MNAILACVLGLLFVSSLHARATKSHRKKPGSSKDGLLLCEAFGEPCISYERESGIGPFCWGLIDQPRERCCDETGRFQSPIDIPEVSEVFAFPTRLKYNSNKFKGKFENTGIQPNFKREDDEKVYLMGVPGSRKGRRYYIENVHFHVGVRGERRQTENLMNNETAEGEAHIVHVREDFGSVQEGAKHPGGLLVISIFLDAKQGKDGSSPAFNELIDLLPAIRKFDEEKGPCAYRNKKDTFHELLKEQNRRRDVQCEASFIDDIEAEDNGNGNGNGTGDRCNFYSFDGKCGDALDGLINPNELLADDPTYYYFYGGLTTPPCSEAVVWLVAKQQRRVPDTYQPFVRAMESQIDGEEIGDFGNLRPLQKTRGRDIRLVKFVGSRSWEFWINPFRNLKGVLKPLI